MAPRASTTSNPSAPATPHRVGSGHRPVAAAAVRAKDKQSRAAALTRNSRHFQARRAISAAASRATSAAPPTIEGELVAKSTGTVSEFSLDDRVFHQKFGYGRVVKIDGNKLTIAFDKAGEKKVVDSFVERA